MNKSISFAVLAVILLALSFSSAQLTVNSIDADDFTPGSQGKVIITVENNLNEDINDVTLSLKLSNLPLISVGSSSFTSDINEDDEEDFAYTLKAANDAKAGNYDIPYTLTYKESNSTQKTISGTFGITLIANPDITVTSTLDNPVVGQQGKVNLKIINKGLGNARFVSIIFNPSGMALKSENEVYVGAIDSDDFQTVSFDVLFQKQSASATVDIEYVDFNNQKKILFLDVPITVYTLEKAKQLGIIKQSYTLFYILAVVILIILWFVFRSIRKRRKMRQNMQKA